MFFKKLLPVFFVLMGGVVFSTPSVPEAKSGILDLRDYDFTDMVCLRGEWEFLLLETAGESREDGGSRFIEVPGPWETLTGTPYAAGEYRLKILLPANRPEMGALIFPELSQLIAVELNGKELFSMGNFNSGRTTYTRFLLPVNLHPEMDLTVRLKNTCFRMGGLVFPPVFGPRKVVRGFRETRIWFEAFFAGGLFLAACYHIFFFMKDRRTKPSLFLGLSAILIMTRCIFTGENTVTFLLPGIPWEMDCRIEFISAYLNGMILFLFCNHTFPFKVKIINFLEKFIIVLSLLFSILTLIMPVSLVSRSLLVLQFCLFLIFFGCLIIFFHALAEKARNSILSLSGGIILFSLTLLDSIFLPCGIQSVINLSQLGMFFFVAVQTIVLTRLYGDAFLMVEEMGRALEDEVARRTLELKEANEKLQILSTTDPLTGAANRLKINTDLDKSHQLYLRYGSSYGVIMFDLDLFKEVNDNYGHETGDIILKEIVGITRLLIRDTDIISRWGGEEFIVLLPVMDREGTVAAAERIRDAFENHDFPRVNRVTASFGVVVPVDEEESLDDLLIRLDAKLYRAKRQGRNRVVV